MPEPPIISSVPIPETPSAYWFRCVLADGRVIKMSVPKNEPREIPGSGVRS